MTEQSHSMGHAGLLGFTAVGALEGNLPAADWVTLPFTIEPQQQPNWCWAATAVSVARFTGRSAPTQCQLVSSVIGQACCSSANRPCDRASSTVEALRRLACLRAEVAGPLSFSQLRAEIDAGGVVGVRIAWPGSDVGHAVVIDGYRELDPEPMLSVEDPLRGPLELSWSVMMGRYDGIGRWDATQLLLRPAIPESRALPPRAAAITSVLVDSQGHLRITLMSADGAESTWRTGRATGVEQPRLRHASLAGGVLVVTAGTGGILYASSIESTEPPSLLGWAPLGELASTEHLVVEFGSLVVAVARDGHGDIYVGALDAELGWTDWVWVARGDLLDATRRDGRLEISSLNSAAKPQTTIVEVL